MKESNIKPSGFRALSSEEVTAVGGGFGDGSGEGANVDDLIDKNFTANVAFDDLGTLIGGEGTPLLGINPWVPDFLENFWYDRVEGAPGLFFSISTSIKSDSLAVYDAFDKNGDFVGYYVETSQDRATVTLTVNQSTTLGGKGGGTSSGSGGAIFLERI